MRSSCQTSTVISDRMACTQLSAVTSSSFAASSSRTRPIFSRESMNLSRYVDIDDLHTLSGAALFAVSRIAHNDNRSASETELIGKLSPVPDTSNQYKCREGHGA